MIDLQSSTRLPDRNPALAVNHVTAPSLLITGETPEIPSINRPPRTNQYFVTPYAASFGTWQALLMFTVATSNADLTPGGWPSLRHATEIDNIKVHRGPHTSGFTPISSWQR
jgi:hypothetical protein